MPTVRRYAIEEQVFQGLMRLDREELDYLVKKATDRLGRGLYLPANWSKKKHISALKPDRDSIYVQIDIPELAKDCVLDGILRINKRARIFQEGAEIDNVETPPLETRTIVSYITKTAAYIYKDKSRNLESRTEFVELINSSTNFDRTSGAAIEEFYAQEHIEEMKVCYTCVLSQIDDCLERKILNAATRGESFRIDEYIQFNNKEISKCVGVCPKRVGRVIERLKRKIVQCETCKTSK